MDSLIAVTPLEARAKLAEPQNAPVLIIGAPRSGTTWVGKIFDSHPDVLYRHEPDQARRNRVIPTVCRAKDVQRYAGEAGDYVRELQRVSTLKTAGSLPVFPKRYRGAAADAARRAVVFGLRAMAVAPALKRLCGGVNIPDLIHPARRPHIRLVMKSVTARGRARLYADALPGCRIIFVLRDPWGQVASMMRGETRGKFEKPARIEELLATEQAAPYGLTVERLHAMPQAERLAWSWALLNEKALNDLAGHAAMTVVRYEELCAQPKLRAREMFAFAGLSWDERTEGFIDRSAEPGRVDRYYGVFKDAEHALNRWRAELSDEDRTCIDGVVRLTSLAAVYPPETS